ncbi:MAG: hypothetical protein ACJAU6_000717 [Alphaproteobacteria bacterium]
MIGGTVGILPVKPVSGILTKFLETGFTATPRGNQSDWPKAAIPNQA